MDNVVELKQKNTGIVLDYRTLNSESFNQAMSLLSNHNGFTSFAAARNMAKITKQHFEELKIARELYNKWVEAYTVKDEAGHPKMAAKPHPLCPWEIKEGMEEKFDKELLEFLNTKVELKAAPISPDEVGTIKLTPAQVIALEPIFAAESLQTSTSLDH